jgi:hypothetical protein
MCAVLCFLRVPAGQIPDRNWTWKPERRIEPPNLVAESFVAQVPRENQGTQALSQAAQRLGQCAFRPALLDLRFILKIILQLSRTPFQFFF